MSERPPPPSPFPSWLDWAVAGNNPSAGWEHARTELAELRAKAEEWRSLAGSLIIGAKWWQCSSCQAMFPPIPSLPDGTDPNAGAQRCTKCVEVEELRLKVGTHASRGRRILELEQEAQERREHVRLLREVVEWVEVENRSCVQFVGLAEPYQTCITQLRDRSRWCYVCVTNDAIARARAAGALAPDRKGAT